MVLNSQDSISVVIPVYNNAATVRRALSSVAAQTVQPFEVLVVVDRSTDESLRIVKQYEALTCRVLTRDSPGAGGYAARNLGIRESTGEWIAFLDADDEWCPDHLEETLKLIHTNKAAVVATNWKDSFPGNIVRPNEYSVVFRDHHVLKLNACGYFRLHSIGLKAIHTNVVTAKKSLYDSVGGFPADRCTRGGDTATWLSLVHRSNYVLSSPRPTAIYHRENSFVTATSAPLLRDSCVVWKVKEIISQYSLRPTAWQLRRVANLHLSYGILKQIRHGKLRYRHLADYYVIIDPVQWFVYLVLSLMVESRQVRLFKRWQRLKKRRIWREATRALVKRHIRIALGSYSKPSAN